MRHVLEADRVVRKGKLRHSGHAEDEKHYGRVVPQDKGGVDGRNPELGVAIMRGADDRC
jgi:hypothetical protein